MSINSKLILTLLAFSSLLACTPSSEEQTQIDLPTEDSLVVDEAPTAAVASSVPIQRLLLDSLFDKGGLIRGFSFGQNIDNIKKAETWEEFEQDASYIGYTFEAESLQSVDILYKHDAQNLLSAIDVDIYVNSAEESAAVMNEVKSRLTQKYGQPTDNVWKLKPSGQVKVASVSTNLDHGLTLEFLK